MIKILLIGVGIHERTGTGITLKNFFKDYPKNQLCFVTSKENGLLSKQQGYDNIYVLGFTEMRKRKKASQSPGSRKETAIDSVDAGFQSNAVRKPLASGLKILVRFIKITARSIGLLKPFSRFVLSPELESWISAQKPSIVYDVGLHLSLSNQIVDKYNFPLVLHIMDDWIKTEVPHSFLYCYWQRLLNKGFVELISKSKKRIAISAKMAEEYKQRYGVAWEVFHNPIISQDWLPYQKNDYSYSPPFKVAYFGRVTPTNRMLILQLSDLLSNINKTNPIEFHVYSQIKIKRSRGVIWHEFIPQADLGRTIPEYDLLVVPFLFNRYWTRYTRLSMPTKASEYMMSGVPILLITNKDTALYDFFTFYDCGFVLTHLDKKGLDHTLKQIIADETLRKEKATKAKEIAAEKFSIQRISREFLNLFEDALSQV